MIRDQKHRTTEGKKLPSLFKFTDWDWFWSSGNFDAFRLENESRRKSKYENVTGKTKKELFPLALY